MTAQTESPIPDSLASARKWLAPMTRAHILNYLDIARRDVPDAAIAMAVSEISTAMMDRTMTPQEAAIALLYASNPGKKSLVIRDIACNLAAAERIQVSVDAEKGTEQPTVDAAPQDPAKAKKPKKSKGAKALKPDTSWLKRIGTNGTRLQVEPANESALWAADRAAELVKDYRKEPHVRDLPVFQVGRLPGLDNLVLDGGDEGPIVIVALVRHQKKGCPKNAIRDRSIREAASQPIPMSPAEMEQHLLDEWYAHAVAETDVFPIVWSIRSGELLVSATGKAVDAVTALRSSFPAWAFPKTPRESWKPQVLATDLRATREADDARQAGSGELAADFRLWMLWLCQLKGEGTWFERTETSGDGWRIWVDDEAELVIAKPGQERKIVSLKNAAADHGALIAALAEGGRVSKIRMGLCSTTDDNKRTKTRPKKYFHVTFGQYGLKSVGLPCQLKVSWGLTAAVLERLTLLRRLDGICDRLSSQFEESRVGEWEMVCSRLREWIGTEVTRRWRYDDKTGQGFLFDLGN